MESVTSIALHTLQFNFLYKEKYCMKLRGPTKIKIENLILFSPGFIIYVGLIVFSIILCFYYSFFDWDGIRKSMEFIGFTNYIRAFSNDEFRSSIVTTFYFAILGTILVNVISLTLAVLLKQQNHINNFYRAAFFFPQLISLVAVGFIFKGLLSYIGIVNTLFEQYGIPKFDFLGTPRNAPVTVLIISIWQTTGFATVLYLAGLQAIPLDLYEAAKIDGANAWIKFRAITFPWLAPSFTAVTIFLFTGYMKIFDIIFVMTGGGPAETTQTIAVYIMKIGFNQFRISYASAVAIYMTSLVMTIALVLTGILRKREEVLIS
ncbi:sugar ABC transporter permease [Oceanispirochaeta sp. M1]|nr:sugar ABC transporter permease [Oceanispirochaeta sp. M1]